MLKFDHILVDGNYWARKFFAVHKKLYANLDGKIIYTGMAHGFLIGLCNLKQLYKGSVIIIWDRGHTRRRKIDQSYKSERRKKAKDWDERELYNNHLKTFTKLLKLTGVKQASKAGEEGDDILYTLANRLPGKNLIVTNDHDLYQALDKNVYQLLSKKNGEKILSTRLLERETGLTPTGYSHAMAVAGCSGDGVAGVRGVGLKTAMGLVRTYPELVPALLGGRDVTPYLPETNKSNIVTKETEYFSVGDKGPSKKMRDIVTNPDTVYQTRLLTKLYNIDEEDIPVKIKLGKLNIEKLELMLELAEMHECVSRIEELGRLCK